MRHGATRRLQHNCGQGLFTRLAFHVSRVSLSFDPNVNPVLLSLNNRGFYVLRYTAIPEQQLARVNFELVDPNTGEGGSAEALVDPRLVEALNNHNMKRPVGKALLIWIDAAKREVSWQLRSWQGAGTEALSSGPR